MLCRFLFTPEKVLERDGGEAASKDPIDWDYLVETAHREGVAALLYYNVRRYGLGHLLPDNVKSGLTDSYHRRVKTTLESIAVLRKVFRGLQEAGIDFLVFKGIALGECVYPQTALRGAGDCDLLVKKRELLAVDKYLNSLGYRSVDSSARLALDNPAGYLASVEYRRDDPSAVGIHVHWHLVNTSVPATAYVAFIDMDALWEKSRRARVVDADTRILSPEHLIIYLCEHALRVGHSFDRLILVCDLFFALRFYEKNIDWGFLVEEARRFRLDRFVYFGLLIASRFSSFSLPPEVMENLKPVRITLPERWFLNTQLANERLRGSSIFVHLAMNECLLDKAKFIIYTFFPPRSILFQRRYTTEGVAGARLYLDRVGEIGRQFIVFLRAGRGKGAL
ncbi:MAG: nucleotidyltransferase family protein [Syntrophobacterales bacterium]|jgi:hypothetical protein|nr:nucleotidyltransferase family protein [Syntrophobacterales bacterium]